MDEHCACGCKELHGYGSYEYVIRTQEVLWFKSREHKLAHNAASNGVEVKVVLVAPAAHSNYSY